MKRSLALLLPLLLLCGCAALPPAAAPSLTAPPSPAATPRPVVTPQPTRSPVFTDWSKLTPYAPVTPVYTEHAGYRAGEPLAARADYGTLLPYLGRYVPMPYVFPRLPLFGLVNDRGELVTDPIYAECSRTGPFLLLSRGGPDGSAASTAAAADGSWVQEVGAVLRCCGNVLAATDGEQSLAFWSESGVLLARFPAERFVPWLGENYRWGGEGSPWVEWCDGQVAYVVTHFDDDGAYLPEPLRLYLELDSGAVTDTPPADYAILPVPEAPPSEPGLSLPDYSYLDPIIDPVTGAVYFCGYRRPDAEGVSGELALLDEAGNELLHPGDMLPYDIGSPFLMAGLCSVMENDSFSYYRLADGALVFRYPLTTNTD